MSSEERDVSACSINQPNTGSLVAHDFESALL